MFPVRICIFITAILFGQAMSNSFPGHEGRLTDVLLREMVARMGNDLVDPSRDYIDVPSNRMPIELGEAMSHRSMGDLPGPLDYDEIAGTPSLRDREYLAHSSLLGNMLGSYGGEEKEFQRFKPSASESTITSELKSDGVLPAYCNPPNPCPMGYTAEDGCIEEFENTAGFSRDYQAMQECMCDTEHMFQCPDSTRESEITALARSIQNEGVIDSTLDKIMAHLHMPQQQQQQQRMVSKKFNKDKNDIPSYMEGEMLPIAAKKGNVW